MEKNMKRAERRHQMFSTMWKRLKQIKDTDKEYYDEIIKKHRKGHFRKSSVYDCGNASCWLCHFDKLIGKRPLKEQRHKEDYESERENPRNIKRHYRNSVLLTSMG